MGERWVSKIRHRFQRRKDKFLERKYDLATRIDTFRVNRKNYGS